MSEITLEDIYTKLGMIQTQLNLIQDTVTPLEVPPAPYAVKPVGTLSTDNETTTVTHINTIPNTTPPVPAEYSVGTPVYLNHDPLQRPVPITFVGDGIVQLELTPELKTWLNVDDNFGGFFYPHQLTIAK